MQTAPEMIGGYKVVRELGRGAMGVVYLAYQESLGRDVAIKVMATEFVRDEEFVERFRREGRIAARLRHPNIVQVYDFSDRDGLYFIAMEYLGSRTLKGYVHEHGRVSVEDAVRLCDQLLAALDHAHRQGIVHRDIKPANVMVTDAGDAALTDFSIAQMKSASKLTQTGSVLGTPEYMAPEQFEGKVDGRSDLYATGIILYEMLTGFSPFHADTIAEIMKKQLFNAPDAPSVVDFTIPEGISQVVVKSLAKNPDERYQNAAEMRQALNLALRAIGSNASSAAPIPAEAKAVRPVAPAAESVTAKSCAACGELVNKQRFCPGCGHDTTRPVKESKPVPAADSARVAPREMVKEAAPVALTTPRAAASVKPVAQNPDGTASLARPPGGSVGPPRLDLRSNDPPSKVTRPGPPPPRPPQVELAPPREAPPKTAPVPTPGGGLASYVEDDGITILGWATVGCFALLLPYTRFPTERTQWLALAGFLGMVCLLPSSLLLSVFLFFRRASAVRVAAPFAVAAGLLMVILLLGFYAARNL